jgi:hypothetical protein
MTKSWKWDQCVSHRGAEAARFVSEYFSMVDRKTLLVAGAGFDPRATVVCRLLAASGADLQGFFVREERPNPSPELMHRAEYNAADMTSHMSHHTMCWIDVFAPDGAVIGGREIARILSKLPLACFTDVLVDIGSLSIGVAYPIVRYLYERTGVDLGRVNLHVVATDCQAADRAIVPIACDRVGTVVGFQGRFGLDDTVAAVKLWLPQLILGKRAVLEKVFLLVNPEYVCPILPFPASTPRLSDELVEHYRDEFESVWGVDDRDILYADEGNPLDLYRTVLRIDDARKRVFEGVGGSMVLLSPLGNKASAIGALMAAMERDFPVVYVESIGYMVDFAKLDGSVCNDDEVIHVWLHGDAYPAPQDRETMIL